MRLLPTRDKRFYEVFDAMTTKLVEASDLVITLTTSEAKDSGRSIAERLKRLETECDSCVAQTITLLEEASQPPYDRDDITHLIKSLDDIMDWLERFASRFVIYRLSTQDPSGLEPIRELADIVLASCRKVQEAVACLPKHRPIDATVVAIHDFESQADTVHHEALMSGVGRIQGQYRQIEQDLLLLRDELGHWAELTPTPVQLTGWLSKLVEVAISNRTFASSVFHFLLLQEVYKALERASDASDTVAITLKRMVIKNV